MTLKEFGATSCCIRLNLYAIVSSIIRRIERVSEDNSRRICGKAPLNQDIRLPPSSLILDIYLIR